MCHSREHNFDVHRENSLATTIISELSCDPKFRAAIIVNCPTFFFFFLIISFINTCSVPFRFAFLVEYQNDRRAARRYIRKYVIIVRIQLLFNNVVSVSTATFSSQFIRYHTTVTILVVPSYVLFYNYIAMTCSYTRMKIGTVLQQVLTKFRRDFRRNLPNR